MVILSIQRGRRWSISGGGGLPGVSALATEQARAGEQQL
jgi:hypothetical protein